MQILRCLLSCLLLITFATGCASIEHSRAVKTGEHPWYLVKLTSPDTNIQAIEIGIYKLRRQADSPEGKSEGLKTDKFWGEGHGEIKRNDHGTIRVDALINWETAEPKTCIFQVRATYLDEKEQQSVFSFESTKNDLCEKIEFDNPYLSGRIQGEGRKWMTLDFHFHRTSEADKGN